MNTYLRLFSSLLLLTAGCSTKAEIPTVEVVTEPSSTSQAKEQRVASGELAENEESVSDVFAALNAVVNHCLTDPALEDSREFYGTIANRRFALVSVSGAKHSWPNRFVPNVPGFEATAVALPGQGQQQRADQSQPDVNDERLLGLRLLDLGIQGDFARIEIAITNVGGDGGAPKHIGGCILSYDLKLIDKTWSVKLISALDA